MANPEKQKPKKPKSNPPIPSKTIVSNAVCNTGEAHNDETNTQKRDEPLWSKITRNWLIVIFTAALTFYTAGLYNMTVKQAGDARDATIAAKKSVELFEQTSRIDNRAWVGLIAQPNTNKDDPFISYREILRGGGIYVNVKNFGKTPADSLFCYGKLFFSNELPKPKTLKRINSWGKVLSPGESFQIEFPIDTSYSYELIKNVVSGKKNLFIYGVIIYRDIYGFIDTTEFMSLYNRIYGFNQY
ncbi:MAG: hypothetical protein WCW40_09470, partial [Bacteroidota bacterium]